jgi:hypothetical protein
MRFIDIEKENPPEEWCRKADKLTEKLKKLTDLDERKKIIDHHNLWNDPEIKKWLLSLSHNKCWYSEAREICSFYDVDHFRPKKHAKNLDNSGREGYWWLAYDWKNYRISGNIVNRPNKDQTGRTRGKRDYFPLRMGSPVATTPFSDINDEIIYILDPTDPCDPLYLTFDRDGKVYPSALDKNSWAYERAKVTIELLHLDYFLLKEERMKVWQKCERLVNEIDNLIKNQDDRPSVTDKANLKAKMKELREMISEKAELSSTARACLLNSDSGTAKIIVSRY